MADDRFLERIERKLDELHDDHRSLQLQVAKLPLEILEKHETRFAPAHRFSVLERSFWGTIMAAVLALVAAGVKAAIGG